MSTSTINASLKILMLHGYTHCGPRFDIKTRALQKALISAFPSHAVSFSFPTGPHRLLPPVIPPNASFALPSHEPNVEKDGNFSWWRRPSDDPIIYTGLEATLGFLGWIMRAEGPFDGVVGFSQGGALAGLLASALETNRVFPEAEMGFPSPLEDCDNGGNRWHPPLKFAVVYSGFRVMDARCRGFYDKGGIAETRVLHFIGALDSVLDERRSQALVNSCGSGGKRVIVHPGGHFVPRQRPFLDAVAGFVKEVMEPDETRPTVAIEQEEKVEDMKLPLEGVHDYRSPRRRP